MGGRVDAEFRVFEDFSDANRAIAQRVVALTEPSARKDRRRFSLVLAGGGTPRGLYRMLASEFADQIDWAGIDLFWGDERYVPHDDPQSNFGMAQESLIDHIRIPPGNLYPMPTHPPDPVEAAAAYDATLRAYFNYQNPRFDLVLLGIGGDGHTASLFPGTKAVRETNDWVVAVTAPVEPQQRLSLTFPILNWASNVYFLASGEQKAMAVKKALSGADPECPASLVDPTSGRLTWWLDTGAASKL